MIDPYFTKVVVLANVTAPLEQPSDQDWLRVEAELGLSLPTDYKHLVSELGTGSFGEFALHNPVCTSEFARLSRSLMMEFRTWHEQDELGVPLYPDAGGYLWIGHLPNGMDLLLSPGPNSDSQYRLLWFEVDGPTVHEIPVTLCRFLHDLYFGVFHTDWSEYVQGLVWAPGERFFSPRPGGDRGC